MLLSTPGLVLHTTPYADTSVIAKVFTRQLGVRSYIIKGVRSRTGRVKQNMLQPLSSLDMVVYDNHHNDLNHIRELSSRHPQQSSDPVELALRFFMTEVLYRALHEEEPMQGLWDYVEEACEKIQKDERKDLPIAFLLNVSHYFGIEPMDNHGNGRPYFDLQQGRFVVEPTETTLSQDLSLMLHYYLHNLSSPQFPPYTSTERSKLLDALIAYFQLHLSGFRNFNSHEILHTILR